jgi:hypothetical protein
MEFQLLIHARDVGELKTIVQMLESKNMMELLKTNPEAEKAMALANEVEALTKRVEDLRSEIQSLEERKKQAAPVAVPSPAGAPP